MQTRAGAVTLHGQPLTLVGALPTVGSPLPDVVLIDRTMKPVRLSDYKGKAVVLVTVPSLDTPVCDAEARRFNREAAALGDKVVVLVVSTDLPFAQTRWCGAAGVDRVVALSDHRETALGIAYGILIQELRLLARCVFVSGADGVLRYVQVVREISQEPDYDAALQAIKAVL
jgi:thioredoxin-dependent peroxiredoxin